MKLAYKIFGAFVLTSLVIIVLMTGIMRYFAERHFTEYINRVESETLSDLIDKLGAAYSEGAGWGFLKEDPQMFRSITRTAFSRDESDRPPLPAPEETGERSGNERGRSIPPPPRHIQQRISQRISLFDDQMHVIAGDAVSTENHILKEISIEGKTVGWLGLKKRQRLSGPREKTFLREQSKAFFIIGCLVLFLAALVSFLLSRHLLKPVGKLAEGAHALASRRFDTRITVSSGDELGQLADDFNKMAQTLEKYENLRRQWLSDISHELRTPTAILQGEIEAIIDGVREMNTQTLESVHAEVVLLGKLIGDLHELSVAETGGLLMELEPVNIHHALLHTLKIFEPRFAENALSVEFEDAGDMNVTVMADRDRLAQVFSNIFENSLRYTSSPGTIRIQQTVSGYTLQVIIEDSEPGVNDEALEHLFDRLYRTDPSRSRKDGGSGLGLAIAKSIIEMFSGVVSATHSSLGGVRIEIILPIAADKDE